MSAGEAPAAASLEHWARSARAGDEVAFAHVVEATQVRLVAFLRLQLGQSADAEDVAQEAYLRAWSGLARFDPRRSFGTWLFTIARHLAIERLRRAASTTRLAEGTSPLHELADRRADPVGELGRRELCDDLWRHARARLGDRACVALWLRYSEEWPAREIGRVLGLREGAVRALLQRSRERLARTIAPTGETAPQRAAGSSRLFLDARVLPVP